MKKIILFSSICIITAIPFSSCRNGMSVTKRHYTGGYYIAHTKSKHADPVPSGDREMVQTKTKKSSSVKQNQIEQKTLNVITVKNPTKSNTVSGADNKKLQRTSVTQQNIKHKVKLKTGLTENPRSQIKSAVSEIKKTRRSSSDGGGLSLFWIVILVVLLLWVLGFLAGGLGLGGLLNILLVVALILLILWLFRIL